MNKRNIIRLLLTLTVIFILNISDLVELHKNAIDFEFNLGNEFDKVFSELLFGFHRIDTGLNTAKLSQLAFLAAAPLFLGQNISADLSISGTYYFTRQNNRAVWYVKRALSLLGYSFVIASFTCLLNTLMTEYYDVGSVPKTRVALVLLSLTFCIFTLLMLSNISGIFFGSVIGLAAAVLFAAIGMLLVATPMRAASIVYNCTFRLDETYADMAVKVSVNAAYSIALFIAGLTVIRKKELSLVNAEHLF